MLQTVKDVVPWSTEPGDLARPREEERWELSEKRDGGM